MKNKIRSYGFWTALAGAVVVLLNAIGSACGFTVDNQLVTDIIMAVAGLLVVLGVVSMPKGESKNEEVQEDQNTNQAEEGEQEK